MLSVIVAGVVVGALYAVAGLGLVVLYRASRVLNFALGGIGAVAAYVAVDLLGSGLPYWVVIALGILVGGVCGLLVEFGVLRPLSRLPPLTIALGSLGALLIMQGAVTVWYGTSIVPFPEALANAGSLRIGGFAMSWNQVLILAITVVAAVVLGLVIQRTRLGLAMRAASSGPQTAELLGVSVSGTRLWAGVFSGGYGALAALLATPLTFLSPSSFTTFLLTAIAAVVLGGFTSLRGVVIGAVAFGIAINLVRTYLPAGLTSTYTFIGVALVLVFRPSGLFGQAEHDIPEPEVDARRKLTSRVGEPRATPHARDADQRARFMPSRLGATTLGWSCLLVVFALVPTFLSGPTVLLAAMVLASFIAVLGLNILTGHTGQISLGHAGFLAIGSYAAAISVSRAGVPPFAALAIAVVAGAVAGVIIGLPATRLTGIYLAVLTLVFTFAIPELAKQFSGLTGGSQGLAFLPPELLSGPAAQYWFVLAVAAAVAALVLGAGAGRLGRKWRAVRDSESGARALGLNPTTIKLGAFAISSGLGALGGAITGMQTGFIGPTSYGVFLSIYMLLAVILGGSGSVFGSLLGAIFITIVPQYVPTNIIPPDIIFGAVLIVILIVAPGGLSGSFENLAARARNVWWVRVRRNQTRTAETAGAPDVAVPAALREQPDTAVTVAPSPLDLGTGREAGPGGALLEVRTVSAGYGLFDVLHGASLEINSGEIVALVGANGAGKSTLLRVVSQTITPSEGEVLWKDQNLSAGQLRAPHRVARAGISHVPEGRAIFPDLTVEENLTMGTFGHDKRKGADGVRTVDRDEILTYFPRLRERLRQRAGTLSGGEQQMLAIGRALRGQPELLMLDEPSLGLAPVVAEQVFEVVREIAASGLSVLLVEQNAAAALSLAHRAYVIAAGEIVLSGSGAALREDERVAQTYLAMGTA